MNKALAQLAVLIFVFFGLWFGLREMDFIDNAKLDKFSKENEKRLGDVFMKSIKLSNKSIEGEKINLILDTLKRNLCVANGIVPDSIKLHIIQNTEVNAFALPGNNIVVFTGLINYAKTAEELAGVMSHEIGHVQKEHVKKKLIKEIGITMLATLAGGEGGQEIARTVTETLSSRAFDRDYEREADEYAVEVMAKANANPEHFSNIMFRLSQEQSIPEALVWMSTHPDTKERVADIIKHSKKYSVTSQPLLKMDWEEVKTLLD